MDEVPDILRRESSWSSFSSTSTFSLEGFVGAAAFVGDDDGNDGEEVATTREDELYIERIEFLRDIVEAQQNIITKHRADKAKSEEDGYKVIVTSKIKPSDILTLREKFLSRVDLRELLMRIQQISWSRFTFKYKCTSKINQSYKFGGESSSSYAGTFTHSDKDEDQLVLSIRNIAVREKVTHKSHNTGDMALLVGDRESGSPANLPLPEASLDRVALKELLVGAALSNPSKAQYEYSYTSRSEKTYTFVGESLKIDHSRTTWEDREHCCILLGGGREVLIDTGFSKYESDKRSIKICYKKSNADSLPITLIDWRGGYNDTIRCNAATDDDFDVVCSDIDAACLNHGLDALSRHANLVGGIANNNANDNDSNPIIQVLGNPDIWDRIAGYKGPKLAPVVLAAFLSRAMPFEKFKHRYSLLCSPKRWNCVKQDAYENSALPTIFHQALDLLLGVTDLRAHLRNSKAKKRLESFLEIFQNVATNKDEKNSVEGGAGGDDDKKNNLTVIDQVRGWIRENPGATKEDYDRKLKELKQLMKPL